MEGGKMWLSDFLPQKAETRPTRPTTENHVGRHQSLMAVAPSDTSDTSDMKNGENIFSGENHQKEEGITQVSYKNPESVRHLPLENEIVRPAPVARLLCGDCRHWRPKPGFCWWVGLCGVFGGTVRWREGCSLPAAKGPIQ
jgi:hypothetical protein